MGEALDWLVTNWENLVYGLLGLTAGATLLAKLTPTDKDDKFLARVARFIGYFDPRTGWKLPFTARKDGSERK